MLSVQEAPAQLYFPDRAGFTLVTGLVRDNVRRLRTNSTSLASSLGATGTPSVRASLYHVTKCCNLPSLIELCYLLVQLLVLSLNREIHH